MANGKDFLPPCGAPRNNSMSGELCRREPGASAVRAKAKSATHWIGARLVTSQDIHQRGIGAVLEHIPDDCDCLISFDCDALDISQMPAVALRTVAAARPGRCHNVAYPSRRNTSASTSAVSQRAVLTTTRPPELGRSSLFDGIGKPKLSGRAQSGQRPAARITSCRLHQGTNSYQ